MATSDATNNKAPFQKQPYFSYEPVDASQATFRLCRLLPGSSEEPVVCELENTPIAPMRGEYSALSYTWGKPADQDCIVLNGNRFYVQPNLFAALTALRKQDKVRVLWIDAICIDQFNISERDHQVSLMGHIYSGAGDVLVWLGPAGDNSDAAFDFLKAAERQVIFPEPYVNTALSLAARRNYWRRAWIRQELILAKEIVIHCGNKFATWHVFSMYVGIQTEEHDDFIGHLVIHRQQQVVDDPYHPGLVNKNESLLELLVKFRDAECGDIRDRIFSLLSLARDTIGQESKIIDYSMDPALLFCGLLHHFEPQNPIAMGCILQRFLQTRYRQLLHAYEQNFDAGRPPSAISPIRGQAEDFINQMKERLKEIISQRPATTNQETSTGGDTNVVAPSLRFSRFIDQSCRLNPCVMAPKTLYRAGFHERDLLFPIEGSNIALVQTPALFGYLLSGFAQKQSSGSWERLPEIPFPDVSFDERGYNAFLAVIAVASELLASSVYPSTKRTDLQLVEQSIKDSCAGLAIGVEMLCWILLGLSKRSHVCLVECQYLVPTVFGHKLLGPLKSSGEAIDGFDKWILDVLGLASNGPSTKATDVTYFKY
jgi:Heterokaryon incompatibility protein (HET)